MRPSQVITALLTYVKAKQPVMLWGSPGVGKSDVVRQVAKQLGIDMIDLRLSQLDPVDLRGVPSVEGKGKTALTKWNTPNFLPTEGKGILFLDEIVSAAQATQAAAYQLVLDRKLGDYELPPGWVVIAAGNRAGDRAIVNQMSSALKNRFAHINYEVNHDDWCDWAVATDIQTEVLAYIRYRPNQLNEFEKRSETAAEQKRVAALKDCTSFATPRSWKFLSDVLKVGVPREIELEVYGGIIGEGCAAEFMAFMKHWRELPNFDALLMNPDKYPVPENVAVKIAISTGLAAKVTVDNIDRVMKFMNRMPTEFQVVLMKDAVMRNVELTTTKTFNVWGTKNARVMM